MPDAAELVYARHVEQRVRQTENALSRCGFDRVLIHSGSHRFRFQDDQHPPFRAHPHFVSWLPLAHATDCLLEVRGGRRPRLWYCQPDDFWHLPPADPEPWWADVFDVEVVSGPEQWQAAVDQSGGGASAIIGESRDFPEPPNRAELNPRGLLAMLDEYRTVKSAWERDQIAGANRMAVPGHRAAAEAFRAGCSELEIHLQYLAAVGQDQDELPYNSIVGLNQHAAVLHYQHRSARRPESSRSFLIDAGAASYGYAADVTRTWAGEGEEEFAGLVEQLDALQQRLVEKVRPGTAYPELHREAQLGVAAILEQAGLVRMTPEAMLEAGLTRRFLPHGLGHFIGVQVHDVAGKVDPEGKPLPAPESDPALRLTRTLEPGNVLTVEPGMYFIPALLEPLRDSGLGGNLDWDRIDRLVPLGGIRVEDNVLVTEGDPVNYTRQAWMQIEGGGSRS